MNQRDEFFFYTEVYKEDSEEDEVYISEYMNMKDIMRPIFDDYEDLLFE